MTDRPEQPPEARLLEAARKRAKLSGRAAAERAGISEGRWRQIESGYQTVRAGIQVPATAPAETLAQMALAMGLTPDDLAEVGRADAAEELRELGPAAPAALDAMEADIEEVQVILRRLRARGPAQVDTAVRVLRALAEESDAG